MRRGAEGLNKMAFEELWQVIRLHQGEKFYTAKGLEFTYSTRGAEMFVDRKEKSITKASVKMAYDRAEELNWIVTGPKKLGCFGASYLYPIFLELGLIEKQQPEKERDSEQAEEQTSLF